MIVSRLQIRNLRNIDDSLFEPCSRFNILIGNNGSGKTSFLESIYLLARGKSFRSSLSKRMVKQGENRLVVFSKLTTNSGKTHNIGVQIEEGRFLAKIDGQLLKKSSLLASYLPLLLITPDADKLISGSPRQRRRFLDWGLFHVEQSFLDCFQSYNRALLQRNNLLRTRNVSDIHIWNAQLGRYGQILNSLRSNYASQLGLLGSELFTHLSGISDVSFTYTPGWNEEHDLVELLDSTVSTDLKMGFTQRGPHRADYVMKIGGKPALDILSGGQHKLAACSLIIAQAQLYMRSNREPCVMLIDDLAAELDPNRRKLFLNLLYETGCQVFISSTDPFDLKLDGIDDVKMFHVEHGTIKPY